MTNYAFRVPGTRCECGVNLDGATPVMHDDSPKPKKNTTHYSVCIYCGRLFRFDDNQCLQPLTPAEFSELPAEFRRELLRVVTVTEAMRELRPVRLRRRGRT